jgi:ubiquinone/menaquinone biosynthesis C-methylase UbiE
MTDAVNLWGSPEHALGYLSRADSIPHRTEGEAELLAWLPAGTRRVLDLGSGDGRLLALVRLAHPESEAVALDFSDTMIERLRERFEGDTRVQVRPHNLDQPLPDALGRFDAVVSSFAIHHVTHERKRAVYAEVFRLLLPGGVFCNLDHVASATKPLHEKFLACLDVRPEDEDPSNKLLDVQTQLAWLRAIGFADVDCHWKWRELALMAGSRPPAGP